MDTKPKPNEAAIDRILRKAGPRFGDIEVAYHLTQKHYPQTVSQFSLRQWRKRGIPEAYWPDVAEMAKIELEVIWRACGG